MFQKFAESHGFDKRHFYIQCGFRKITGANFNVLDLRIFIEYTLKKVIADWMQLYNFKPSPYYKIQFARHMSSFNDHYIMVITDLDQMTEDHLLQMKLHRPYSVVFIRIYYK